MAGKWWISKVLVVAAVAVSPRAAAAQADTRPSTQPASAADYIAGLSRALGEGTPAARYEAAQRLVAIDRPDARAAVTRALTGTDAQARTAAARAAVDAPSPDPAWVTPLVGLLDRERTPENTAYAAQALSRFDEDPRAFDALIRVAIAKQPGQLQAINALGRVVQKRAAAALIGLTNDPRQPTAVHEAAADSLSRISPQISRTDRAASWRRWWDERNPLPDRDWRTRVVAEQHPVLEQAGARGADRLANLRKALYQLLYEKYEQQPPPNPTNPNNRKSDYLRDLLNDPDSDVRAAGARIVPAALTAAQVLKQDVWDRLVDLLADASPEVRLASADALEKLRDAKVFDAIVRQLPVESDLHVKRTLVQILGHMEGRQAQAAIPVLQGLLKDPSESVAATAADALASLAPTLNPQARQDVFSSVQQTLVERTGPPGQPLPDASVDLRASLVLAMGASANWNNEMALIFHQLIDEPASAVRQAAARALASAGREAGPILSERLNLNAESDPDVRAAAALSLGSMTSLEFKNKLLESMRPGAEPSPTVREAAWQSLQRLLPYGDHDELSQLARAFKDRHEPDRQLVVQNVIANKTSPNQPLSKAAEFQTAGDITFTDLKRPAEAIRPYREALKYYRQVDPARTPLNLIESLLRAYLASDQIDQAIEESRTQIRLVPKTKIQVGETLAAVAEAWSPPQSKNPADWEKARNLIRQSVTLELAESERGRLEEDLKRLPLPPPTYPSTTPTTSTRPGSI